MDYVLFYYWFTSGVLVGQEFQDKCFENEFWPKAFTFILGFSLGPLLWPVMALKDALSVLKKEK